MKTFRQFTKKAAGILSLLVGGIVGINSAQAQCSVSSGPSYSSSCTGQYFTSITASGTGVTSTIALTGFSCAGTYFNYYASQGVNAPVGGTVNLSINRVSTSYTAYLTVYVDWNNGGTYESTELCGSLFTFFSGSTATTYSFAVPSGAVTGTHLHMRVMLSETPSGAPCTATWGQSADFYVNVNCPGPALSVSPATSTICAGGTGTVLTATGAGTGGTYAWGPTTGLSSGAGSSVTANPTTTTTYTVTGTTSAGCSSTTTTVVSVNPAPAATVTASGPLAFCAGGSVTFTAPAGTGYTYQWYNTSGAISGATNMSYTATTADNYSVIVTNGFGCSASSTTSAVTVYALPTITTTSTSPSICDGTTTSTLAAGGAGTGGTYSWSPATGLSATTGSTVTAAPTASTVYEVTGTTSTGCSSTASTSITVNPAPTADVTPSGPLNFCDGSDVVFTAPAASGYTYQWYNTGAAISGATDLMYIALTPGNYTVKVTNGFGCSVTSTESVVTVNPLPDPTVTLSGSPAFCAGSGSVTLSATTGTGYSYQWYNTGTTISGANSSSYTATTSGDYVVKVVNDFGCSIMSSGAIITAIAQPVITPAGDTTFCAGTNILLSVGSGGTSGITYQWQLNTTDISGATANSYVAGVSGQYYCTVSVAGSCTTTTAPILITIHPSPAPVVTFDGATFSTATGYTTYQWYINTVAIPGATSHTVAAFTNASYRVLVTDANGCSAYSTAYDLFNLGVASTITADDIKIYPNPSNSIVHIDAPEKVNVTVTGLEGKMIMAENDAKNINIQSLPDGVYLISVFDQSGHRLLVQRLTKQ